VLLEVFEDFHPANRLADRVVASGGGRPTEVQGGAERLVPQGLRGVNDVLPVATHHDEPAVVVVLHDLGKHLGAAQVFGLLGQGHPLPIGNALLVADGPRAPQVGGLNVVVHRVHQLAGGGVHRGHRSFVAKLDHHRACERKIHRAWKGKKKTFTKKIGKRHISVPRS